MQTVVGLPPLAAEKGVHRYVSVSAAQCGSTGTGNRNRKGLLFVSLGSCLACKMCKCVCFSLGVFPVLFGGGGTYTAFSLMTWHPSVSPVRLCLIAVLNLLTAAELLPFASSSVLGADDKAHWMSFGHHFHKIIYDPTDQNVKVSIFRFVVLRTCSVFPYLPPCLPLSLSCLATICPLCLF